MRGWQQSKGSKIETRKQLPSEDDSAPVSTVQQCLVSTTAAFGGRGLLQDAVGGLRATRTPQARDLIR